MCFMARIKSIIVWHFAQKFVRNIVSSCIFYCSENQLERGNVFELPFVSSIIQGCDKFNVNFCRKVGQDCTFLFTFTFENFGHNGSSGSRSFSVLFKIGST